MAQELYRTCLPWRVYVFGDYDPSGLNIFETVRDDVRQFFRQFNERNGTKRPLPKFEMVTITEQQVFARTRALELERPKAPAALRPDALIRGNEQ